MTPYPSLEEYFFNLFSHNNFEKSRKFSKSNTYSTKPVKEALEKLGNPQYKYKTVHIAGTVGKGSTTFFISKLIKSIDPNFKIGCFFSPHLTILNERIQINSNFISDADFYSILESIQGTIDLSTLSFFDCLTIIAFIYFKNNNVDWAIIETGLGGRLDSTNNLKPQFCVITPIDEDHKETLGGSLQSIAYEKAGIIQSCSTYSYPQKYKIALDIIQEVSRKQNSTFKMPTTMNTIEQSYLQNNFDVCKWICEDFFSTPIYLSKEIANSMLGRIEQWCTSPTIYFDSAHNEIATLTLSKWLSLQEKVHLNKKWNIYMNTLKERSLEQLVQPFINNPLVHNIYLLATNDAHRFYSKNDSVPNNIHILTTIDSIKEHIQDTEIVHLITGSMYLYKIYKPIVS